MSRMAKQATEQEGSQFNEEPRGNAVLVDVRNIPSAEDVVADVAVVGAGVTLLSAAYLLAKAGKRVLYSTAIAAPRSTPDTRART